MKHWTLGAKLTGWFALVVGVALLICGVGALLYIQHEQIEALDDQLQNEAHTFFGEVVRDRAHLDWTNRVQVKAMLPLTRNERSVRIMSADGRDLYQSRRPKLAGLPALHPGLHTIRIGEENLRVGVFEENGVKLYLGAELTEIDADNIELLVGLLVGLPLLVATVAGGGWWLARKTLAPVRDITAAAEQITADRLDQRLPAPEVQDEIGRLADVLNAMFDRLDKSFRQAMRFSADASHELKTPLTVLRSSIEDLLESPTLAEADQRSVAALLEQTRRLSSITESLLLLSRADAGRLKLDLAEADIGELITGCADDASIMAEARGITIETHLPEHLSGLVDAGRLTQILLNLLDNAVKYNRAGGRVKITTEQENGGGVFIRVANTGPGIPPAQVAQIFERFFRFDPSATNTGHGLGLSLARELTRAHAGELLLLSSDSEWTIFQVHLRGPKR